MIRLDQVNPAVATVKLLIDGAFVEFTTSDWRPVVNPATQAVLARVPFATPAGVDCPAGSTAMAVGAAIAWGELARNLYALNSKLGLGDLGFSSIVKLAVPDA